MFSFLTPYITIIKGVGALVVVLAIWYFIHQYRTGQEAKAQLQQMSQQLADERSCVLGTVCAQRTEQKAKEAADLVKTIQATADAENAKNKAEYEAKEQEIAQNHAQTVTQLQKQLSERNSKLAERVTHDAACKVWMDEVLPECVL